LKRNGVSDLRGRGWKMRRDARRRLEAEIEAQRVAESDHLAELEAKRLAERSKTL